MGWAKIREAKNGGEEKWYTLQNKIPVYIGYFTACAQRAW
jgi:murein L,D-transpeptidase YcbB/YkuD